MFNDDKVPEFEVPTRPPKLNPPPKQPCQHQWIFQRSDFKKETGELDKYQRIDTYYCEKCLDIRELVNKEGKGTIEPYWFNPSIKIKRY